MSANLQSESLRLPIFVTWLLAQNQCGSTHLDTGLDIIRLTLHVWKASYMPSVMSLQKGPRIALFIFPVEFLHFDLQTLQHKSPGYARGQIYPFNMRGLTNFYVTDPLVTHWRCSSSVTGIKWIRSWGVAAQNCCEIPDKLSFSGSRARAEWVGGQIHDKRALPSAAVTVAMKADLQASPWMETPPPPPPHQSQGFVKSSWDWKDFSCII